jgi:hypothetical protein
MANTMSGTYVVTEGKYEELYAGEELLRMFLCNDLCDAMPDQTEDGCKDTAGYDCSAEDMDLRTVSYDMLQKACISYFAPSLPLHAGKAAAEMNEIGEALGLSGDIKKADFLDAILKLKVQFTRAQILLEDCGYTHTGEGIFKDEAEDDSDEEVVVVSPAIASLIDQAIVRGVFEEKDA